jgi:hypothetical protein
MAFSSIESSFFQQMINEIPGISMPFKSRNTLTPRISAEFELDRARPVEKLGISSQTVALSLDGWTSTNALSIRAVIGHWLSEDFVYKEAVLEFAEIEGTKTGEYGWNSFGFAPGAQYWRQPLSITGPRRVDSR